MTITMGSADRVDPPTVADERTLLTGFLDYQRDTLAWKCSGLTDEQLALRAVEPSSLSLLGLLRHLTEVERGWFNGTIAGEEVPPTYYTDDNPDGDFDDLGTHSPAEVHELDFEGSRPHRKYALRWVLIHMIEEYARHNGHADFLRERIDGATGE
jgi:hypothetical protein